MHFLGPTLAYSVTGQRYQEKPGSIVSLCIPGTQTTDPLDGQQTVDPLDQ
jgi:hypothetical protein